MSNLKQKNMEIESSVEINKSYNTRKNAHQQSQNNLVNSETNILGRNHSKSPKNSFHSTKNVEIQQKQKKDNIETSIILNKSKSHSKKSENSNKKKFDSFEKENPKFDLTKKEKTKPKFNKVDNEKAKNANDPVALNDLRYHKKLCLNPIPDQLKTRSKSNKKNNGSLNNSNNDMDLNNNKIKLEENNKKKKSYEKQKHPINSVEKHSLDEEKKKKLHKEKEKYLEKYSAAVEKLQEYSLPDSIPCREKEKKYIEDFLIEGLQNNGSNQTLYISGIPGIGKTVSFLEVIKNIKSSRGEESNFQFININAMTLKDPENIYLTILEEITGIKNISRSNACIILNELFRNNRLSKQYANYKIEKKTRIILLDELDYLLTKDQALLYNLFEWPHCKYAHIIVAGIANTVDFPERLQPKIASRIGNRRLTYKPYSSVQIEQIILDRITNLQDVFNESAITFVSKKIASFSSDIRRTLHVCRKSVEICQQKFRDNDEFLKFIPVDIEEIRESYAILYSTPYVECLKAFPLHQKLILIALAFEIKTQEIGRISFANIFARFSSMISRLGRSDNLKWNEALQLVYQMMNNNIVVIRERNVLNSKKNEKELKDKLSNSNFRDYDVNVCISLDDITNSLMEDELFVKFKEEF